MADAYASRGCRRSRGTSRASRPRAKSCSSPRRLRGHAIRDRCTHLRGHLQRHLQGTVLECPLLAQVRVTTWAICSCVTPRAYSC